MIQEQKMMEEERTNKQEKRLQIEQIKGRGNRKGSEQASLKAWHLTERWRTKEESQAHTGG